VEKSNLKAALTIGDQQQKALGGVDVASEMLTLPFSNKLTKIHFL
jgi:hypothetical protein